jgi:hypothetical protein
MKDKIIAVVQCLVTVVMGLGILLCTLDHLLTVYTAGTNEPHLATFSDLLGLLTVLGLVIGVWFALGLVFIALGVLVHFVIRLFKQP